MNRELQTELLSMREEDNRLLQALIDSGELGLVEYHPRMQAVHRKHSERMKAIIAEHGWPGISMVGREGSGAAWLLVQHAVSDLEFMASVLPLLRRAVDGGEAEGWRFAYLQGRVLTMAVQAPNPWQPTRCRREWARLPAANSRARKGGRAATGPWPRTAGRGHSADSAAA